MDIELLKNILLSDTPSDLIKENEQYIFSLIPELERCKGFEQNNPWHIYDVYNHILKVVDLVPVDLTARMVALFHDVGKPAVYHPDEDGIGHFFGHWEKSVEIFTDFSKKYRLDKNFEDAVSNLIFYHDINFGKLTDEELCTILEKFNVEELKLLFDIKRADLLAQNSKYHYLLDDYDSQEERVLNIKRRKDDL